MNSNGTPVPRTQTTYQVPEQDVDGELARWDAAGIMAMATASEGNPVWAVTAYGEETLEGLPRGLREMTTHRIKGQEVKVGDDLWCLGKPHRITRIEPYTHPIVTRGEEWRSADADGPDGTTPWGITLEFDHGYHAGYEVTALPGDERGVPHLAEDDYPSPFFGRGAELYPEYVAAGAPGWLAWISARRAAA
jgi:hypothetical protein